MEFSPCSSFPRFVATSLSLLICAGILAGCSGSSNNGESIVPVKAAPMTEVNAESMLEKHVTKNVSQILVITSDAFGEKASTALLTRQEAASFSVPTDADKVELGLLTSSDEQVGVIIFKPEGTEMILTLPGHGLSPLDVLNLDIVINADLWDSEPAMLAGGAWFYQHRQCPWRYGRRWS